MDALAALYPSSNTGSGITSSPLATPAAPVAAPVADVVTVVAEVVAPAEVVEQAQPEAGEPVESAYVEDRPKLEAAFKDMRDNEIPADSVTAYAPFARPVEGVEPIPEGLQAMVKLGLGVTQARAVWDASVDAVRAPVQTTPAGCRQALESVYGDKLDSNLQAANAVIDRAAKTYPGIRQWLATTGLGNSPAFVRQVIDFANRNK